VRRQETLDFQNQHGLLLWLSLLGLEHSAILNILQNSICCALVVLWIVEFSYSFGGSDDDSNKIYAADQVSPALKAVTFALALLLQLLNKQKGVPSSGILFIFWLLTAVCAVFEFQSAIRHAVDGLDNYSKFEKTSIIITLISYPLVLLELTLHFFADWPSVSASAKASDDKNENITCPELTASVPSQLTFQWFWPLAWLGYKKPLEFSDLWDLNPDDKSATLVKNFQSYWKPDLDKALKWNAANREAIKPTISKNENGKDEVKKTKSVRKTASILPGLTKSYWGYFLFGSLLKLVQDLLQFVSPQLLDLLIQHVNSDDEKWKGYFYAVLMFLTVMAQTIVLGQYFQRMFVLGMRIRSAIVGTIYQKSLVLSNAARKESTLGEIVNLMSVDAQRFMDLMTYLNMIWSAPMQIALSLYFLYNALGPSVFAGVGLLILLIPINVMIANKARNLQIEQMKCKDQRVKLMNEILSGMKVLKLYAWEPSFEDQILEIRKRELSVLKKASFLSAAGVFVWLMAPFLVSLATFATYVLVDENNILDSRKAFVSLTLFNIMRMPMSVLPNIIVSFVESGVSLNRLNKFLNGEEIDPEAVSHEDMGDGTAIKIEKGTFAWDDSPTLQNINLNVKKGSLVAVVGPVGCGKSSLLSAILGEMEKTSGKVNSIGSIAYVAQQAWIQNATLRDNVLFGRPFNSSLYSNVIQACALKPDLEILPGGDQTEIGEKGINLSGGQKQRVSLARAAYNNADVYLFDDPLSAVDSHVGKHLFEEVIGPKGYLKNKTRLIVTHGITYLPYVDQIIVLNKGQVSERGTYHELLRKKGDFADFLVQHASADDLESADISVIQELESVIGPREAILTRQLSQLSQSSETNKAELLRKMSSLSIGSKGSMKLSAEEAKRRKESLTVELKKQENDLKEKLIEAERAETGSVKGDVYSHYMKSMSLFMAISSLLCYILFTGLSLYSNIWLAQWAMEPPADGGGQDIPKRNLYLGVYGGLGLGQALAMLIGNILLSLGCLKAAEFLHADMLHHILRSPMSFFDTTPLGRIVNRFSKDVDVADNTFPLNLRSWLTCMFQVVSTFIIISIGTPWFLVVILPVAVIYYVVQRFYVASSRQLKRLESVTRSPIYSHFSETLTGTMTIRAFGAQSQFILQSEKNVDHNQRAYYPSIVSNRWLGIRLESVGNLIILFAAIFALFSNTDDGSVGLSVSYALSITQILTWLVRMTSDVETNIVAVERIKEYGETPQEAPWEIAEKKPSPKWPENGQINFTNYQSRYREGLDLVLRGISCSINPGEKVGIVGRTGAGKSSLTLGLFRIVEAAGGSIDIDGLNLANMGLHDVRGKLTIIPQDPVLFSGTLRHNLDPFQTYSDDSLWHSLEYAHLKKFVDELPAGLDYIISEGGENLSVGQRQLVCLARALLRKTKILILDEATAAVDLETDDLIQQTIRSEFKECTVLTIAHRLNTIMDCNRVMVLDKGEIREFDSPNNLMQDTSTIFFGMAKDAGLA
ncbi:unnamed protein product, partial [Allacma fusca]